MVPAPSAARIAMATQMQEAWRRMGIAAELDVVDPNIFVGRRKAGQFDLLMDGVTQDPTPSGLTQSWTCAGIGGTNFARYCNPRVDSLLRAAPTARGGPVRDWRAAVRLISSDVPVIFLAAPVASPAVHRRFTNVTFRPESAWSTVWQWSVRPGQQIERDQP
jgi:ABC-type transport system substrate-binding protein